MAVYREDIADIDITNGGSIFRSFTNCTVGGGDEEWNRFGFRLIKQGQPVSLAGASCIGFFIRPDGNTLVINGVVSENVAYVQLPDAAYVYEGQYTLAIKISGTGYAGTMRIVDGTVVKTSTGSVLDPASEIPSLEDLMEVIERAEAAAEDIDALSVSAIQIEGTRYKISVSTS